MNDTSTPLSPKRQMNRAIVGGLANVEATLARLISTLERTNAVLASLRLVLPDEPGKIRRAATINEVGLRKRDLSKAEWLRPADIRDIYGMSKATVSRLTSSGEVPSVKRKGKNGRMGMVLIRRADMDRFMAET